MFSSQFLLVFSLAFSCYFQEAAFRMANGFPDGTPPHTHTHPTVPTGRQWEVSRRGMKRLTVCVRADEGGFIGGVWRASFRKLQIYPSSGEAPLVFRIRISGLALDFRFEINWGMWKDKFVFYMPRLDPGQKLTEQTSVNHVVGLRSLTWCILGE